MSLQDKKLHSFSLFSGFSAVIPVLLLFFLAAMVLVGCGFQPLYGKNAVGREDLQNVRIENIPNRQGVILRNALIDRFYPDSYPTNPRYSLRVSNIRTARTLLGVRKSNIASRAQMRIQGRMTLTDRQTGRVVIAQPLLSVVTYNILQSQFATKIAEEDALERGLNDIADEILREVSLYFNRLHNSKTITTPMTEEEMNQILLEDGLNDNPFDRRFREDFEEESFGQDFAP